MQVIRWLGAISLLWTTWLWAGPQMRVALHAEEASLTFVGGEECCFTWEVLDNEGKRFSQEITSNALRRFTVLVSTQVEGVEQLVHVSNLPPEVYRYTWKAPVEPEVKEYWVTLKAVPKDPEASRVMDRLTIRVEAKKLDETPPQTLEACTRILMDWYGRRGFAQGINPIVALQRARQAAQVMRETLDQAQYEDYLNVIEKVEQAGIADLTVYCPSEGATLEIDDWIAGIFKQMDPQRKLFFLRLSLPTDAERAYNLTIHKGSWRFTTAHNHFTTSECFVERLYRVVQITVQTPGSLSQAFLNGQRIAETWERQHVVAMYAGRQQELQIALQKGPKLTIVLKPIKSLALTIKNRNTIFFLEYQGKTVDFVGGEINLLRFRSP